jgi:hypothetical protein
VNLRISVDQAKLLTACVMDHLVRLAAKPRDVDENRLLWSMRELVQCVLDAQQKDPKSQRVFWQSWGIS